MAGALRGQLQDLGPGELQHPLGDLGFGRTVASGIKAPNLVVNLI